jgi:hypothetical protein
MRCRPRCTAVSAATNRLGLRDKIRLIPGHCDQTVNLYDWYVCIRNNRVEQLWPITARGAVYSVLRGGNTASRWILSAVADLSAAHLHLHQ